MYIDVYLIKLFTLYKYDKNFPRYLLLINMGVNVRFYSTSGFTALDDIVKGTNLKI